MTSALPPEEIHTPKSNRLGVTTCANLTGGEDSGEDSRKGVSSGSALANADAAALMPAVVGSVQAIDPRAPALTATIICTRNSVYVGVRDQNLRVQRSRIVRRTGIRINCRRGTGNNEAVNESTINVRL